MPEGCDDLRRSCQMPGDYFSRSCGDASRKKDLGTVEKVAVHILRTRCVDDRFTAQRGSKVPMVTNHQKAAVINDHQLRIETSYTCICHNLKLTLLTGGQHITYLHITLPYSESQCRGQLAVCPYTVHCDSSSDKTPQQLFVCTYLCKRLTSPGTSSSLEILPLSGYTIILRLHSERDYYFSLLYVARSRLQPTFRSPDAVYSC